MIPQRPADEKPASRCRLEAAQSAPIRLSGEGSCALILAVVLICADDPPRGGLCFIGRPVRVLALRRK